jgi:hypothetical protein
MQDICQDAEPPSAVITFSTHSIQLRKTRCNSSVKIPFKMSATESRRLISSGISCPIRTLSYFPKQIKVRRRYLWWVRCMREPLLWVMLEKVLRHSWIVSRRIVNRNHQFLSCTPARWKETLNQRDSVLIYELWRIEQFTRRSHGHTHESCEDSIEPSA